jgi:hypothetical protein
MKVPYVDDSELTEIIIQPDGRIYAFGLSAEVARVLHDLDLAHQFSGIVAAVQKTDANSTQAVYNEGGGAYGEG